MASIDSIVFRVHDLQRNIGLVHFLHKKGISGTEMLTKDLDAEAFNPVKEVRFVNYFRDHATGNEYSQVYRTHLASHVYDVSYSINYNRDYMEFNLSLPKYYFGNNVQQLVPHYYDRYMEMYKILPYWSLDLRQYHFMVFKAAFRAFMNIEFGEVTPASTDVQIVRLDMCFNLFFRNVDELEFYQHFLRSVKKKYQREYSGKTHHYDGDIFYPGSLSTFKIYHKKPEFLKHDYTKVKNRFSERVADDLTRLAATCLRYEVAFKTPAFSEYWYRFLAPDNFKVAYKLYDDFYNKGCVNFGGVTYYKDHNGEFVVPFPELKKQIKFGKTLFSRHCKFFLDVDEDYKKQNEFDFRAPFTYDLFSICVDKFHGMCSQFYIGQAANDVKLLADSTGFISLDGKKHAVNLGGFKKSTVKMLLQLLKTQSWTQIQKSGVLSKTSYYKYRKLFDKLGYKNANATDSGLSEVDLTYSSYYEALYPFWSNVSYRKNYPFTY